MEVLSGGRPRGSPPLGDSPRPPRPHYGGLPAARLSARAFRCWLTVYRRIWRSSIWSSVLGPLFYLGAMGLGLGGLVDRHGTASLGGVSYLAFVAPAILATGAMNTAMGEASYPVFGSVKWNKIYIAAQASPLRPGDIYRGHLMFMTMRIAMNAALVTVYMWTLGATTSAWVVLAWPAATLTGLAFAAPIAAWAVLVKSENNFAYMFRFGMMPLMLFSGTFFPLVPAPRLAAPVRLRHAAVARRRPVPRAQPRFRARAAGGARSRRLPGRAGRRRDLGRRPQLPQAPLCLRGQSMSSVSLRVLPPAGRLARLRRAGSDVGSLRLIERHARAYRHAWLVFASGVFEPLFYLLSVGLGLGVLIGKVPGPGGRLIPYREFVAPGLLAVSSMNGAMYDSTFNIFFRLKYAKLYNAVLATPMRPAQVALGEIGWALLRGTIYAVAFTLVMLAMGLVHSPWAVLAVPVAVLIGFAFAALGMTGTTYMKSWQDFDYVILASMPLFLFSATFYPLGVYPRAVQVIVECTPLYQGVVLLRDLTVGVVGPDLLWRAAYLAVLGLVGLYVSGRRLARLLLV